MSELVNPKSAARSAGAFGVVEHEVFGLYVSVDETVRPAAERPVETLLLSLRDSLDDVNLHQAIAHQQSIGDTGFDGLLVFAPDFEPVDDRVHVSDFRFIKIG